MKDYNKENIPLAKELRKNMTSWERKLWYDFLRNYPVRFQRQKRLAIILQTFIAQRRDWSLNLMVEGTIRQSRQKKMNCAQRIYRP